MPRPTKATLATTGLGLTAGGGLGFLLAPHLTLLAILAAALLAIFYLGVILPAVWSTKPTRRQAARAVLTDILHTLRRRS